MTALLEIAIGTVSCFALLALAAVFLLRAKKTKPAASVLTSCCTPPVIPDDTPVTPAPGIWQRFLAAISFLGLRQEWRYDDPWIMLLGEINAGKTSLVNSAKPVSRQSAQGHQNELAITGTTWHFFNKGFLIDPIGKLPFGAAADPKSNARKEWARVLNQLETLRPERALDGILLVISAKTLQNASPLQRSAIAENSRHQLLTIGERFEFFLPVYIVVTGTDAIDGYEEFWRAQPKVMQDQIVGWSAPTQWDDSTPASWADTAFDFLDQQLNAMQVFSSAQNDAANSADTSTADTTDDFFLFPRHLQQLRTPFQHWISAVFQPSAWRNTTFCRGIYFTGVISPGNAALKLQSDPRSDVSFIDRLIQNKILAEPYLGRPTRTSIFSRNLLIRTIQRSVVCLALILLAGSAFTVFHAHAQIQDLINSLTMVDKVQISYNQASVCVSQDKVFQAINQIAKVKLLTFPLSLIDYPVRQQSAQRVANSAFRNIILPGMYCQLQRKANDLLDKKHLASGDRDKASYLQSKSALFNTIQAVADFEKNAQFFAGLINQQGAPKPDNLYKNFIQLDEYLYGAPSPARINAQNSLLPDALALLAKQEYKTGLSPDLNTPLNIKAGAADLIYKQAQALLPKITTPWLAGENSLRNLNNNLKPVSTNASEFTSWLGWMQQSWGNSSLANNPILELQNQLAAKLATLTLTYQYPASILNAASEQFAAQTTYPQAADKLSKLEFMIGSKVRLFNIVNRQLEFNPELVKELDGLKALTALSYMQIKDTQSFTCQTTLGSWNAAQINQANQYVQQYQDFVHSQSVAAVTANIAPTHLFEQIASNQLQNVLNDQLQTAQIAAGATPPATRISAVSPADQQQSHASMGFDSSMAGILKLQQFYTMANFNDSSTPFPNCVQNFAAKNLAHIQDMAIKRQLYQPVPNEATGSTSPFYKLDSNNIKDYLETQFSTVQTYASYATPFLTYLQKMRGSGTNLVCTSSDPSCRSELYWSKTVAEINAHLQAKDGNGQVNYLENLYQTILPTISSSNCSAMLAAYTSPLPNKDLFSMARMSIEGSAKDSCKNQKTRQLNSAYNALAARFNVELAGNYPFSDVDTKTDAIPLTVKNFFSDYEANSANLKQLLAGVDEASWSARLDFIKQLDGVDKLFTGNFVSGDAGSASRGASLKLNVVFNAQGGASPGSDQVVNWSLSSGAQTISYPNNGTSLDWQYGEAIVLDLIWANQSKWSPGISATQSNLQIYGNSTAFSASGDWALFRFIDRHRAIPGAALRARDPARLLLEFEVPVMTAASKNVNPENAISKMYLTLNLSSKDSKTQAPVNIKYPAKFPRIAPQ